MITVPVEDPAADQTTGIVLHGFGADETDMMPIARQLGYVSAWVLPRAPFSTSWGGFSWFSFPEYSEQESHLLSAYDSEVLPSVAQRLAQSVRGQYPNQDFVVGGFSQGGMMAVELSFCLPLRKLLLFSTSLIARNRWETQISAWPKTLQIFQSHGLQDDILPVSGGRELAELLSSHRSHSLHLFEGGHGIPLDVIDRARDHLRR